MTGNEIIFSKIAEALMVDYTSVYYVNAATGEYHWYSADPDYQSLCIAHEGNDFFSSMKTDAEKVVYKDDIHIFSEDLQKDKFFSKLKKGTIQDVTYRLMIHGKPVYHSLRAISGAEGSDYFVLGVRNVDRQIRTQKETEHLRKESEIYNQIAMSLASSYDTIYYVDIETGKFFEFSSTDKYKALHVPDLGQDFFAETRANVERFVFPDDKKFAKDLYYKENILKKLEGKKSFTYTYRLVFSGKTVHYRFTVMTSDDRRNIIVCVKDISEEINAENNIKAKLKMNVTYSQIAESLASNYDVIYYVDISSGNYAAYTSNPIYGKLEMKDEGSDFFADTNHNSMTLIHHHDRDRILSLMERDRLITMLDDRKQFSADYRLTVDGQMHYARLTVMRSGDKKHFIIGVENVDEEVRKEKAQLKALNSANELARRDELTGTKNKTAYTELEKSIQTNIDNGIDYLPFAIVVCDINGLKQINDVEGHKAGDDYIRESAKLICKVFSHSPVFRIGGDEFTVFIRGNDYPIKDKLLEKLRSQVLLNIGIEGAPVIASGMADFQQETDRTISEVFERADNMMYINKRELKEKGAL